MSQIGGGVIHKLGEGDVTDTGHFDVSDVHCLWNVDMGCICILPLPIKQKLK